MATHETGHVLTMKHCIAFACLMNGSNHREESDSRPLRPCPVCLRKRLWNLQVEPVAYLRCASDLLVVERAREWLLGDVG